jgi:hypothetical protein
VRPAFRVRKRVVRNKRFARFVGCIPGPDNNRVVVVLQVKRGHGWLVFRRYRTRKSGCFTVGYRFNRTTRPTLYLMRAQVRSQRGYPYLQGTSRPLRLVVLPKRRQRAGAGPRREVRPRRQGKRRGSAARRRRHQDAERRRGPVLRAGL